MNSNKKILVVDDEEKILNIIKLYLEKDGYEVFTSVNGNEALKIVEYNTPDLVILDLMLPDLSGEKVCQKIRTSSNVPIIMLTAKSDELNIINGFNLGADDYVIKPFSVKQLLARVQAVLRRSEQESSPLATTITFNNELTIDYHKYEVYKNQQLINLTPIEFKILTLLSSHPKQVFSREEIIEQVYQEEFVGYDRAIDSHIKNLRKKVDDNPPKYIVTVFGIGYKFGGSS